MTFFSWKMKRRRTLTLWGEERGGGDRYYCLFIDRREACKPHFEEKPPGGE